MPGVRWYSISMLVAGLLVSYHASPVQAQVVQLNDLTFGTVITGTTTSVAVGSSNAAEWRIRGILTLSGNITFVLPTVLTRTSGGDAMPISFCSSCARYRVGVDNPLTGGTSFDPQKGTGLFVAVLSDIYLWLGGSVSPPLNQRGGTYSGTVVMTVAGLL